MSELTPDKSGADSSGAFACRSSDIDESCVLRDELDENPAYGPGNPDWEHDMERERG